MLIRSKSIRRRYKSRVMRTDKRNVLNHTISPNARILALNHIPRMIGYRILHTHYTTAAPKQRESQAVMQMQR